MATSIFRDLDEVGAYFAWSPSVGCHDEAARLETMIGAERGSLCEAAVRNHWAGRYRARAWLRRWAVIARIASHPEVFCMSLSQLVAAYNGAEASPWPAWSSRAARVDQARAYNAMVARLKVSRGH